MTSILPALPTSNNTGLTEKELKKIDATAQDFEAVFITEMLKPIFDTVEVNPMFGGGKGEEVFKKFQLNEYGKMLSAEGGVGLAAQVKAQLIHNQQVAKGINPTAGYKFTPHNENSSVSSLTTATDLSA